MSEHQMETRRRSRSKTPFLRSNCDHESCEHAGEEGHSHHHHQQQQQPKKKTPNVHTITEESVEVTSSSSTPAPKKTIPKIKTSDYSSDDTSPENAKKKHQHQHQQAHQSAASSSKTTTSSTTTTVITKTIKKHGAANLLQGGGSLSTSTPKNKVESSAFDYLHDSFVAQFGGGSEMGGTRRRAGGAGGAGKAAAVAAAAAKEISQNQLNAEREEYQSNNSTATEQQMTRNTNKKNSSFSRWFGNSSMQRDQSNYEGAEMSAEDHIAYLEYKKAGEYWKTTPKTDYTYSELSPHRRELAPGIVAMPNMSRKSLENHHERINYMIERDPAQEEFIRRRYETSRFNQQQRQAQKLAYDSGDEVDLSQYVTKKKSFYNNGGNYAQNNESSWWFVRMITTIVTTVSTMWTSITGGDANGTAAYDSVMYRTRVGQEERGFFGTIGHSISSAFVEFFRHIYLFISSVLYLDTWLLQSSNADGKGKKRFLIFLLFLLPLLLLGGLYYYLHPTEPFPPRSFSQFTQTLPDLSKIDLKQYIPQEINYEALKSGAYDRYEGFREWSNDYFLYLKTISQNVAEEGRKLFQKEEYYERV